MSSSAAVVPMQKPSLIAVMANQHSMEPEKFAAAIKATCMPANTTNEEFAAFLMVANQYGLNPLTREIYAFPKKGGGIQPVVAIDGWAKLCNDHPAFDGMEFEDKFDKAGSLTAITCRIYRKDRQRPIAVTEYMSECQRPTEPWQKWPARMLRHKATIQAARYAFSFSGIIDQDEAERSPDVIVEKVVAPEPATQIEAEPVDDAAELLAKAEDWFGKCEDIDALDSAWQAHFKPELGRLDPRDADQLKGLYMARADELGKTSGSD